MGIIFLSYRRDDSAAVSGRIYDRLVTAFGAANVFMDVDKMEGGELWREKIDEVLQRASAQIVVIGPKWLDIEDSNGRRRLDDPYDVVRQEIEVALQRGIGIVPVLVEGAKLPKSSELPESLCVLFEHHDIEVRSGRDFRSDTDNLINRLRQWVPLQHQHVVNGMIFAVTAIALLSAATILVSALPGLDILSAFIRQHPATLLATGIVMLLAMLILSTRFLVRKKSSDEDEIALSTGWQKPRLYFSVGTTALSAVVSFVSLGIILVQPSVCPAAWCPPSQSPYVAGGVHDSRMEMYLTAVQSATYVIPGNPQQYTLKSQPTEQVSAVRIDQANQPPYRVAVSVHSLEQKQLGLIIEQVAIVVDAVPASPYPLNIWIPGSPLDYRTNPYLATYAGQPPSAALEAHYVTVPDGKVQLRPGETDQLDIQLVSQVRADVRFHVEIVYKTAIDPVRYTLVLPQRFEVVFSDASNWHPYTPLEDGHFAPTR
jgi:hypothetical protein